MSKRRLTAEETFWQLQRPVAIIGSGTRGCREIIRDTSFLTSTGGLGQLAGVAAISKNSTELSAVKNSMESQVRQLKKSSRGTPPPPHREEKLGGLGQEFFKDPEHALAQLPFFARNIIATAEWFSREVASFGDPDCLLKPCSCGGNIIPQEAFRHVLGKLMRPPQVEIDDIARPLSSDVAAVHIFLDYMRLIAYRKRNAHCSVVVIRDSNLADMTRRLEEVDRLGSVAIMSPFGARPHSSLSWMPPGEAWKALGREDPYVGIWGKKISFKEHRIGPFWRKRTVKDRDVVLLQVQDAVASIMRNDQRTWVSGFPAADNATNIFAVVGNISKPTFALVEDEIKQHGPCFFVPAPFDAIYVTRLANIQYEALATELGMPLPQPNPSLPGQSTSSLESALDQIAQRFDR